MANLSRFGVPGETRLELTLSLVPTNATLPEVIYRHWYLPF